MKHPKMSINSGMDEVNMGKINRMKYYTQQVQLSKYEIALNNNAFQKKRSYRKYIEYDTILIHFKKHICVNGIS